MAATYTKVTSESQTTTGAGDDIIDGGIFKANISVGNGKNLIRTGGRSDTIKSGDGDDFINAGNGNNKVNAGKGDNRILTGMGEDTVTVGAGKSVISTGAGNDTINALFGNSTINAGTGYDRVNLGGGNNKITLETAANRQGSVIITGFNVATDKLRVGESLAGKTLSFVKYADHTDVMVGTDLVAILDGVINASAAVVDSAPLNKYVATELGSFNTTDKNASASATSINDFGLIGGRYNTASTFFNENSNTAVIQSNFARQGFIWDPSKEKGKELSALTSVGIKKGQSDFGAANGAQVNMLTPNVNTISDRGVVLGTGDEVRQPLPVASDRALVWDKQKNGYKLTINDLGGVESYFFDTNNNQQIVGRNILSNLYEKPVLVENGVVTELATLGGDGGTARGLNSQGQIVGFVDKDGVLDEEAANTAALWEKDASGAYKFKNLGTFGAAQATLREINDNGDIIGATSNGLTGGAAKTNPFILRDKNKDGIYTANERTGLGSLGGKTGSVSGINSFGTVVGNSQTTLFELDATKKVKDNHAFVWSEGKLTDLNSLVGPLTYNGAKVVLTNAVAINNFGDIAAVGSFVYKDAITKKDTVGTRAYELKGIANQVVAGGGAANAIRSASSAVAKAVNATNTVISSGKSVVRAATNPITSLVAATGIGEATLGGVNPLTEVNPLYVHTQQVNVGLPG